MISAAIEITRPANCLISAMSVALAAWIAGPEGMWLPVSFAVLSATLLTGAANVINDWFDIEIDRINRPDRVLPSNRMTPRAALILSIILFVCGVFFSIFINNLAVIIAGLSVLLLILYSAKFKRMVWWGNVVVSLMTAVAFIYGALAAGNWKDGIIPAIFAFLFHFGREILKDMEDVAGDAAMSAVTLPIRYGYKAALLAATLIYSVLIISTLIPYAARMYGRLYLVTVIIGVDLVLIAILVYLWRRQEQANLACLNRILKVDMIVGLIAIYLG